MGRAVLLALALSLGLGQALLLHQGVLRSKPFAVRRLTLIKATGVGEGAQNLRVVKLSMPASSVAKKRRVQREVEDAETEEALAAELAAPAPAEKGYLESSPGFASVVVNNMRDNFWLGTVAPAVIISYGVKAAVQKSRAAFTKRQAGLVKNYAFEMLKYDGNLATLREVHAEYVQKLGPKQMRDEIVLEYLRRFFANKTLSGAAVKSLAFIISINKLDDVKAAKLLYIIGKEFEGKLVSVGKVYFLAERILSDPAALALMQTLKAETAEKVRGDTADAIKQFESSQAVLAETAVRSFTQDLPETVEDLTDAREAITEEARLLGMSEEKAMEIFNVVLAVEEEEAEAAARLADEEDDEDDEGADALAAIRDAAMGVDAAPVPTGNTALVVECSQCSYTLFVAKGREAKFFGPSFKCPECGAAKETFKTRPQA